MFCREAVEVYAGVLHAVPLSPYLLPCERGSDVERIQPRCVQSVQGV